MFWGGRKWTNIQESERERRRESLLFVLNCLGKILRWKGAASVLHNVSTSATRPGQGRAIVTVVLPPICGTLIGRMDSDISLAAETPS